MAKVLSFPNSVNKHGYRRVRRRRKVDLEKFGQLNMFSPIKEARIVQLHSIINPFSKALELEEQGDLMGAADLYKEAIKQQTHTADALCNLGILKSQEADDIGAIDYFTKALKVDPRHLEAHYNLANAYSDVGNTRLAKVHYEMAIRINPSFDSGYYNLAVLDMQEGDLENAEHRMMQYKTLADDEDKITAELLLKEIRIHLSKRHQV